MSSPIAPVQYSNLRVGAEIRPTRIREDSRNSGIYGGFGTGNGARMTRQYYVRQQSGAPGELAEAIARDFLGFSEKQGAGSNTYLSRVIPHFKPFTDTRRFYAEDVPLIKPSENSQGRDQFGLPASDELEVTVTYSERKYQIMTDQEVVARTGTPRPDESFLLRYVSWEQQTAAQYQSLPNTTALVWQPTVPQVGLTGKPVLNKKFVIFNEADVFLTWHDIPVDAIPWTAINACTGKTNQFPLGGHLLTFVPLYGAETLICMSPMIRNRLSSIGLLHADITYRFKYYPYGANNFYRWEGPDAAGNFFIPVRYSTGGRLFQLADFRSLFRPEP